MIYTFWLIWINLKSILLMLTTLYFRMTVMTTLMHKRGCWWPLSFTTISSDNFMTNFLWNLFLWSSLKVDICVCFKIHNFISHNCNDIFQSQPVKFIWVHLIIIVVSFSLEISRVGISSVNFVWCELLLFLQIINLSLN